MSLRGLSLFILYFPLSLININRDKTLDHKRAHLAVDSHFPFFLPFCCYPSPSNACPSLKLPLAAGCCDWDLPDALFLYDAFPELLWLKEAREVLIDYCLMSCTLWMGAWLSCLCRFLLKNLCARNSNSSVTMKLSLEQILNMGNYSFLAKASLSLSVITAFSTKSIFVYTSAIGISPHSSSTACSHFSTCSKLSLSVVLKAKMQALAPL